MAKVMISLPDELLARVDEAAREVGETRSRFVRDALRARLVAAVPTPESRRGALERIRATMARYPLDEDPVTTIRRERASH
jgi:metal-responsive CopG/Arc/MetJ family transcriptional regulator